MIKTTTISIGVGELRRFKGLKREQERRANRDFSDREFFAMILAKYEGD